MKFEVHFPTSDGWVGFTPLVPNLSKSLHHISSLGIAPLFAWHKEYLSGFFHLKLLLGTELHWPCRLNTALSRWMRSVKSAQAALPTRTGQCLGTLLLLSVPLQST